MTADAIIIRYEGLWENQGFINKERLALMKDGAILINTARGGLVVEADVAEACRSGKLHGYGADVLAFQFNQSGVLIAPPAYIAQESANDFYTRRIGSLARGRATVHDVEGFFGRGHSVAKRPDGFIYYYALPIYNPFEDFGGGRR